MSARLEFGIRIGHWTDRHAGTGCTVVLPPADNVTSCDIRGSSPSSRELTLLHPDRRLESVDAIVLTGGSAFGLAAADGVMAWLEDRGAGHPTGVVPVPIVPAAVIFDLGAGRSDVRPGAAEGRAACDAATDGFVAAGRVGAGTGATAGKWAGPEFGVPAGLGLGRASDGDHVVTALAVVNPVGDVVDEDGSVLAGTTSPAPRYRPPGPEELPSHTVLAIVATEGALDKRAARWLAARGSDGITTSIRPAHTRYDGDVVFACAVPPARERATDIDSLGRLATRAVAAAIRNSVATGEVTARTRR